MTSTASTAGQSHEVIQHHADMALGSKVLLQRLREEHPRIMAALKEYHERKAYA